MYHKALILFIALISLTACVDTLDENWAVVTPTPTLIEVSPDLGIETIKEAEGDSEGVRPGQRLSMHYVGKLEDGTKFDSSRDREEPFTFTLGTGQVIPGWDQGVQGMKVGEIRKLTIPAELGYGEQESESIPANSTLIFEVELLEILN